MYSNIIIYALSLKGSQLAPALLTCLLHLSCSNSLTVHRGSSLLVCCSTDACVTCMYPHCTSDME